MAAPRLFLIDSYGFIFRAYHARARAAVQIMRTSKGLPTEAVYIFHNMIRKLIEAHRPGYVAAVFEKGPSFREREFAEYKANRAAMPEELAQQIPYVRRLLEAMRIPILEYQGFEADDVIGAIARRASEAGAEVVIVSSDKDLLQLVNERVSMLNPMKDDLWYDPPKVAEFLGVAPHQVADLLALKGDSVDNIPGAPGIGEKGARDLIVEFGSVEALLERTAEVKSRKYRESLENHREQVLLSKRLATVDTTVPIEWTLESVAASEPDVDALREVYRELEFRKPLEELGPAGPPAEVDYRSLESAGEIAAWIAAVPEGATVGVALATEGEGVFETMALGLSARANEGRRIPVESIAAARALLEDESRPKAAHDVKSAIVELARHGVEARGFTDDAMLYAFLLSADPGVTSPATVAARHLERRLSGGVEELADCALQAAMRLRGEVEARGLREVYEKIDLPIAPVLARMERTGVRIEPAALRALSTRMEAEVERLQAGVFEQAGHPFNLNSPQQLGKVLFEEMKLPAPVRYGRGKTISTAADVLEDLAPEYPIVRLVLEYRQVAKLKNTYVDTLPGLIRHSTGRLHTTFNEAGSATGRISSSNPNLQNIPIRTELGREIRAAFVPEPGWKLLVADYSQIELRLLAHLSRDPVLVAAFVHGEDIHTRTAAEVFGVPPLMVTPEHRRNAKAVNFGIVYGLSAFGLAAQLGIPQAEAAEYIRSYFERYAGVRRFIDQTIAEVRRTGVTRTIHGRQRPIPDMNARNAAARGFAERTAVNTPLQGTAADLIKLAMIRIDAMLTESGLRTRMLLQVHDELVFESPPEEAAEVARLVKREMESVYRLEVPLVVDVGLGDNWRDAK